MPGDTIKSKNKLKNLVTVLILRIVITAIQTHCFVLKRYRKIFLFI